MTQPSPAASDLLFVFLEPGIRRLDHQGQLASDVITGVTELGVFFGADVAETQREVEPDSGLCSLCVSIR